MENLDLLENLTTISELNWLDWFGMSTDTSLSSSVDKFWFLITWSSVSQITTISVVQNHTLLKTGPNLVRRW